MCSSKWYHRNRLKWNAQAGQPNLNYRQGNQHADRDSDARPMKVHTHSSEKLSPLTIIQSAFKT